MVVKVSFLFKNKTCEEYRLTLLGWGIHVNILYNNHLFFYYFVLYKFIIKNRKTFFNK